MQSSLPALMMAMALGLTVSQAQIPRGPAATDRFRYDEPSGKCLDSEGREGHNRGSREHLLGLIFVPKP